MLRKATETKLKKYWYCLLGKELYVYRSKDELQHKGMHNLVGTFIKEEPLNLSQRMSPYTLLKSYFHQIRQGYTTYSASQSKRGG